MPIVIRLCSGKTGFEVLTGIKIDLERASAILRTKIATKHLLLLNYDGVDVSMYPSGRMIIKTGNSEESLDIARRLLAELGLPVRDEK